MLAKVLLIVLIVGISGFATMMFVAMLKELLADKESDYPDEI